MWIKIIFLFSIFFMQSNSENLIRLLPDIVNEIMKIGYLYVYGTIGVLILISVLFYVIKILFRSYFKMKSFNESYEKNAKKYIDFQNSINQDIYKRLFDCNREQSVLKTLLETRASLICCICQNEKATQTLIPCGHFCLCGKCLRQLKSKKNEEIYKCPQCREPIQKGLRTYAS